MRRFQWLRFLPLCLLAWVSVQSEIVKARHVEAELITESFTIAPGDSIWVGLRLKLEPHWHVYWKNPGDAGLPVSLDWVLPAGFSSGPIQWPYPHRIEVPPLMNYGYENEILFPVHIVAPTKVSHGKITLKAKAKWVVCKEICLPGSADLSLTLTPVSLKTSDANATAQPDPASPSEHAALFEKARAALPILTSAYTFTAIAHDSILTLIATSSTGATLGSFIFFPEIQEVLENAAPQKFYPVKNGFALDLKMLPLEETGEKPHDSLIGVAVSESGWNERRAKALQVRVAIERGKPLPEQIGPSILMSANKKSDSLAPAAASNSSGITGGTEEGFWKSQEGITKLLIMLSLAFLGGMILNLMPCVLPVLSLKIFDFVKRAGESRWKIFSHGLVFTAGVLVSFWILAGLLLILRSGGAELGWGFQLQSPGFLVVLCALFFFFSLNLFGVFELGYLFTRVGGATPTHGWLGSFLGGVTATIVATPCTAPFMGSAMGFAFTQPPYYALLVFTFLGLGMASPYLVLSGFPGLMKFLPKPGEWMEHLKQFMGFPLLATAIWLAWVLGKQAGVDALIALLFVLLLAGMSAWILGKWTALHRATPVRIVAGLVALAVFLPAFVLVLVYLDQIRDNRHKPTDGLSIPGAAKPVFMDNGIAWENFSEARVEELVSQGKPVFIDFTADWCLSCKVNEKVVLGSAPVRAKIQAMGLNMLRADWTLRDDKIARALAKYGRNSIPLYVLYSGKGLQDFVILPEVLTNGIVLEALEKVDRSVNTTMN